LTKRGAIVKVISKLMMLILTYCSCAYTFRATFDQSGNNEILYFNIFGSNNYQNVGLTLF